MAKNQATATTQVENQAEDSAVATLVPDAPIEATDAEIAGDEDEDTETEITRTDPIDVDPDHAKGLLAGWRGVYHLFNGRVDRWDILPGENIVAHGLTMDAAYDPEIVLTDLNRQKHRIPFFDGYAAINQKAPQPFTSPQEMTSWAVSFFKGSVDDGGTPNSKTPAYVRSAISNYKSDAGLKSRRGPKTKVIRLDRLGDLDVTNFADVPDAEVDKIMEMFEAIKRRKAQPAAQANS